MEHLTFEVYSRFRPAADANRLLYTPLPDSLTYRPTRHYLASVTGDLPAARAHLLRTLVDPISQSVLQTGSPAFPDALFCLSYGIKPGVLDLEKQAILAHYADRSDLPFTLHSLTITQKLYIFGTGDKRALAARFCRDVCNPAIHSCSVS